VSGVGRLPRRKLEKAYRFAAREVKTITLKAEHRLRIFPMWARFAQSLCLLLFLVSAVTSPAADYTIREGETLFAVARGAQVPVEVLQQFNGISDAARLKPGTVIRIPQPYTVKKGDTLYGIARQFSVPVARLQDLNQLGRNPRIKAGDRLYLPTQQAVTVATPADPGVARQGGAATPGANVQEGLMRAAPSSVGLPAGMTWPLPGHREPVSGKIAGLVFFGSRGDVVRSATAGEVKWVAPYWGLGKIVLIKAQDGVILLYAGNEEILVNVGDRVSPGSQIARLGESPQGGGAKLYFSIQDAKSKTIDPEKYFSAKSRT
jgi:lipoprotein YgeR